MFHLKDKKLGVAEERHRYDLPLNKDASAIFLIILIALMSFLASMALAGYLALGNTTTNWVSGLENKLTIEIPAENAEGKFITAEDMKSLTEKTQSEISQIQGVTSARTLSDQEVKKLVEPWLGNDILLTDIPLPGLISVELENSSPELIKEIDYRAKQISPTITIDTHESWLGEIIRLTRSMQFCAAFIALIIGLTTIIAIAGSIRSRMSMHQHDVELLHLMGASDLYITKQFQRHALIMAIKGSIAGLVITFLTLFAFNLIQPADNVLMPGFNQDSWTLLLIALLPFIICAIAIFAARHTILHALARMP